MDGYNINKTISDARGDLALKSWNFVINDLRLGNALINQAISDGTANILGSMRVDGTVTFHFSSAAARKIDVQSAISGAGEITLTSGSSNDNLTISSANNPFTGTLNVSQNSSVVLSGVNAMKNASSVILNTGSSLKLTAEQTLNNLSGSGSLSTGGQALMLNNTTDTAYSGVISGSGSITKTGTGKLTLSKSNTYTGGTTISEGTFELTGSTSGQTLLGSNGTVTIQNGATLLVNTGHIVRSTSQTVNVEKGGEINYTVSPGGGSDNDFRLQSGSLNVAEGGSVRLRLISLGYGGGTGSTATINGGSMTLTTNAYIGNDAEEGTFTLNSGTLNATSMFTVGQYREGAGTYNQNGGTATIKNLVVGNNSSITPTGYVNLAGGTLNVTKTEIGKYSNSDGTERYGKAFFSQTGGTFTTPELVLGASDKNLAPNKTSLMELSGGTLNVTKLTDPSGYFAMTGGTLNFQKNGSTNPSVSNDLTVGGGTVQVDGTLNVGGTYTQTGGELRLTDGVDKISAAGLSFSDTLLILDTEHEYGVGDTLPLSRFLSSTTGVQNDDFTRILMYGVNNYWGLTLEGDTLVIFADQNGLPEPSSWALLLLGAFGLMYWRKK